MRAPDFLRELRHALVRDRLRVALTMAGIAVGGFSVAMLVSLGAAIQAAIGGSLKSLGENLIIVTPEQAKGGPLGGYAAASSRLLEADLAGIAPGAAATLTVPAWPERVFAATVTRVLDTPENRQGIVMFPVLLSIANHDGLLRPGMTAYVEIRTVTRRNVMTVPNQALAYARGRDRANGVPPGGARHLYARRGADIHRLDVRLGESDDTNTEITALDALDAHEQILLKDTP